MGGGGGVIGFVLGEDYDIDARKRSSPIVTRSMSSRPNPITKPSNMRRRNAKTRRTKVKDKLYRPSKMPKLMEASEDKLYKIPGSVGACYTYHPPEEYIALQKEHEEMMSNDHLTRDPSYFQQQNESLCCDFFARIQETKKEMADYELVEPMAVTTILARGCWAHMNFKAKHKDAADSSTAIYFAELDVPSKKVTCLTEMDIDLSTDTCAYKRCHFCHPEDGKVLDVSGVGCVYHPVDAKLVLR